MKNWLKWSDGRHQTGYSKLLLVCYEPYFDAWVLKYVTGSYVSPHRDVLNDRTVYRLNVILQKTSGGSFQTEKTIFNLFDRIILFRPDMSTHSVSMIESGVRYVLSVGVSFKKRI